LVYEGGMVELVALLRASNIVIVNEATMIKVFLIGSLSFVQLFEVLG